MRTLEKDERTGLSIDLHAIDSYTLAYMVAGQRYLTLRKAIEAFDKEVAKRLAPAKPTLDLEHPPKGLITKSGSPARVVGKRKGFDAYPYVILIEEGGDTLEEYVYFANKEGWLCYENGAPVPTQLTTGPVKKEGWVNLFRHPSRLAKTGCVYKTRDEAILAASYNRIATVKITWEE